GGLRYHEHTFAARRLATVYSNSDSDTTLMRSLLGVSVDHRHAVDRPPPLSQGQGSRRSIVGWRIWRVMLERFLIVHHSLRRTFASLLYEAGASPAYVM